MAAVKRDKKETEIDYREALKQALRVLQEDRELVEDIRRTAEESPFKYYYLGYTKEPIVVEVVS